MLNWSPKNGMVLIGVLSITRLREGARRDAVASDTVVAIAAIAILFYCCLSKRNSRKKETVERSKKT